ncbi:hypothetical protein BDV97DRAFT_60936 [Delphinella strobiligena]|nr:hypothetical protein BDV97DRAFT_60936 [Delphinella strobiligena]
MPSEKGKLHHSTPPSRAMSSARREKRIQLEAPLQGRPHVKKTGLLDLPNELQNMIYALSLPVFDESHIASTTIYKYLSSRLSWIPHGHAVIPALCQVNSKIRQDTMPMFLGANNFTFYNHHWGNFLWELEALADWLLLLRDVDTARMRNLKFGRSAFLGATISFDESKKSWSLDWRSGEEKPPLSPVSLIYERKGQRPDIARAMEGIRAGEMGEWDTGLRVKNLVRLFYAVFFYHDELNYMSRASVEKLRVFLPDDSWLGYNKSRWDEDEPDKYKRVRVLYI